MPRKPRIYPRLVNEDDREFIELARKRFKQANDADKEQRERELADLQFYAGDQWPADIVLARKGTPANTQTGMPPIPARPTLVINKVREPVRQVLNQERQADLGVEIAAADDFGEGTPGISPQEIELREGLVRKIQRESQAADARSWAFMRATIAGRGYYRVMTRYVAGKTNDLEVYVDRIYNQAAVSLDPAHEQPDASDIDWGFIGSDVPLSIVVAEHPDFKDNLSGMGDSDWRALGAELPDWFSMSGELRFVHVVEYWYTERSVRKLLSLADGSFAYEDEIPDGVDAPLMLDPDTGKEMPPRQVIDKQIKWAKMTGVQVLERTDWEGKYIPIIKVLGEELQPYDSKRRAEGMVRPARGSQEGYNAMVSAWVERQGLLPLPPFIGPAGFDEGFEQEYALANTRVLSALHYNDMVDGRPINPPTRTSIQLDVQGLAASTQLFDECIRSTTQRQDITNLDPQIKSDRQLKRVLNQTDQGTSHFLDNLSRSIRYEGLIENDLLYPVYGRPGRIVRVMNPRGETQGVMLHQPFVRHPQTQQPVAAQQTPGQPLPPDAMHVTLTPDATFNVTVKVTKNYDTRREEQESVLSALVQSDPAQMGVVGDLLFKYNDGPGHEELESRYKAVLVPPVQALLSGKQGPDPQLQQTMQENAQLKQMIQSKLAEEQAKGQITIAVEQGKAQARLQEQSAAADADLVRAAMDNEAKIEIAKIGAGTQLAVADLKSQLDAAKLAAEQLRTIVEAAEEHRLQKHDHAHEAALSMVEHAQAKDLASHQAAVAPKPEAGAGA